jgi:ABC-2 type transport system ATP-binding protein
VLVAQALVHRPPVIVLDEPTAGVDVELRQTLWQFIARLNKEGHTVLLTTHYLEEAEALCGRIAMLKQGRVVALDRTSALLAGTASTMLRFKLDRPLPPQLLAQSRVTGRIVQITAHDAREVESILATLHGAGCEPEDLEIGRADLEDVFLEIMQAEMPQRVPVQKVAH